MNHECVIGLLHHCDYSSFATLKDLEEHIEERKEYNRFLRSDPIFCNREEMKEKEWTLKSYADKRINTNLSRFDFCPYCGKEIDWKAIRERSNR